TPVLQGRAFTAADDSASPPVVIINETLAKRAWPGENAVGKLIRLPVRGIGPLGRRLTRDTSQLVIGVVRDIKNTSLKDGAEPAVYYTQRQFPFFDMQVVLRGRGDIATVRTAIREEMRRLDPGLPLNDV